MITCHTMRAAVILSATLFVSGTLLLLLAETTGLMVPTAHTALLLVFTGVLTLAIAFAIAVLPGNAQRLSNCLH